MDVVDEKAGVDIVNLLSGALGGKFVSFVPAPSAAQIPHVWTGIIVRCIILFYATCALFYCILYAVLFWVMECWFLLFFSSGKSLGV